MPACSAVVEVKKEVPSLFPLLFSSDMLVAIISTFSGFAGGIALQRKR